VTAFKERLVSCDTVVRTHLKPDEHVLAIGRCADVTERGGPEQGGTTDSYVMVTDQRLRWVPRTALQYEGSLGLDEVTGASEHHVAHHYSIALLHLPLARLHVVPAHRFLKFQWGNAVSREPLTRTELAFSRRDTAAASALRRQLLSRGVMEERTESRDLGTHREARGTPYRRGVSFTTVRLRPRGFWRRSSRD
jgi:hypothetical protein